MTEAKVAWDEAGSKASALGLKLKMHFEEAKSEVEKDQAKNLLEKMAEVMEEAFSTVGDVAKDSAVRSDVLDLGRALTEAMGATFAEVSDDVRKAFTCHKK
jgi:enamine deaminase RidA (YjgF/YER057c/UK114 family)